MLVGPQAFLDLVVGHAHAQGQAVGEGAATRIDPRIVGEEHTGQVVLRLALPGRVGHAGGGVLFGGAAGQVPELAARRGEQFDLVQRVHRPSTSGILYRLGQAQIGNVQPDVHAHVAEQEAREILVGLFTVDDTEEPRVRAITEGLGAFLADGLAPEPAERGVLDAHQAIATIADEGS